MLRRATWAPWAALGLVLALAPGCPPREDTTALLLRAHALGEEYRWAEARDYARRYLITRPDSAPGHLLYAKGCLRVALEDMRLSIAQGELETALALFEAAPDLGPLADAWEPNQFLGLIHHELATVYFRRIYEVSDAGVPEALIKRDLERAREHVDLGLQADPESKSLQMMRETIAELLGGQKTVSV